ncbi:hypothetical protein [Mesoflavibacter sp. CH_XMU1404-2]|uniref:hypothetical protein n=1 Tax=Mesoflavibacter sp. CH_XMU1404-2 TaxID=3107766 RepID=UPI00300A7720
MKYQLVIAFLGMVSFLFPEQTRAAIQSNKLKVTDTAVYIRKQFTAGNTAKLIDGSTDKLVGITNVDGNKFDAFRNLVITDISVKYGKDASATDAAAIDYNANAMPAALRNAELVVRQGSRVVVSMPLSTFEPGKNASPASIGADAYSLKTWAVLVEGQPFTCNIEFANGATIAGTDNHFVEVQFFGAETGSRVN